MISEKQVQVVRTSIPFAGWLVLFLLAVGACSSKEVRYPQDHERIRRIDQAVESLRDAYQKKNLSGFRSAMLELDQLEMLQRQAEADFDAFQTIALEFSIERIMIEGDDIDTYIHWHGIWKKDVEDPGLRQRGHARLQWVGAQSILLRGFQGDLPFGMKAKHALSEAPPLVPASQPARR